MEQATGGDLRIGAALEAAAEFFADYLWSSEIGAEVRARIMSGGLEEQAVRDFGVGYVPGDHSLLLEHLDRAGFSADELYEAGIATRSSRGHLHSHFRSRIMFPVRDPGGGLIGFAGMATNPGPSWPLWLTSPDRGRFAGESALFGIDRAAAAIAQAGRAVVLRDCLEVLRRHQDGRHEAVAVIRSPITDAHRAQIAAALGTGSADVTIDREQGSAAAVVRPLAPGERHREDGSSAAGTAADRARSSESPIRPDPLKLRSPAARAFLQIARLVLGVGIPLVWLAILQPDFDSPGGVDPAVIGAFGAVAVTYIVLSLVAGVAAARVKARSKGRRMRTPWERGATEWQPIAWTYHMLEDILIGAAIASIGVCMVLFLVFGGFTN